MDKEKTVMLVLILVSTLIIAGVLKCSSLNITESYFYHSIVLAYTPAHTIRHSPFSATPLRRIAIMALLMSSSDAMDESTLTTSKSTGTQQNLSIQRDWDPASMIAQSLLKTLFPPLHVFVGAGCCNSTRIIHERAWPALVQYHLQESESQCVYLHTVLVVAGGLHKQK